MQAMPSPGLENVDLFDLKLLPAWLKEPAEARSYARYTGEEEREEGKPAPQRHRPKPQRRTSKPQHPRSKSHRHRRDPSRTMPGRSARRLHGTRDRQSPDLHTAATQSPAVAIRFTPYSAAFENVVAQIKSGSVAYSLFALARLFLEKTVGYEVCVTAEEQCPLYQLGENGVVAADREFLERNAFRFAQRDFYRVDVVETEPIKGNFSNVARCPLSGTLLGPTNYHNYQPQLRSLYEQRFSRRMSFPDYQRQIEIVGDSALIERWKDEARKVTTYTTLHAQTPATFSTGVEAERHFRSQYLPGLIRTVREVSIGGALSRRLPDRRLNRAIEDAWARETRSPSKMMQELAGRFRQNGLHVFRHRRGMLFVSPIRPRAFNHEHTGVSPAVNGLLQALAGATGMNRKQLFEKLPADSGTVDAEPRRLALASDLRWLINEGYVIEFNDGSLDLPRAKATPQASIITQEPAQSVSISPTQQAIQQLWMRAPLQLTWREP